MTWLCINCETLNFDNDERCIVCNDERYFSATEVHQLIENDPEIQELVSKYKKANKHIKWLKTRHKTLTEENKKLQEDYQLLLDQKQATTIQLERLEQNKEDLLGVETLKKELNNYKKGFYGLLVVLILVAIGWLVIQFIP